MKKSRILPALLVLMLLITGCKAPSVAVPESVNHVGLDRKPALSGTVSDGEGKWAYRITTYTVTGEHCAADDARHVLTRHSYQTPSMEVLRAEGEKDVPVAAVRAVKRFNEYFQEVLADEVAWFDEMAAAADEDYRAVGHQSTSLWQNSDFHYSDESELAFWSNEHLVCITTTRYSYSGGAHPSTWRSGEIFDLRTGRGVTVADLTDDIQALRSAVEQELLRQAKQRLQDSMELPNAEPLSYYDDYPETLAAWLERSVTLDDRGMTVIFSVYDIAPYAAGEQAFSMSYEFIAPYLNDYGRQMLELD